MFEVRGDERSAEELKLDVVLRHGMRVCWAYEEEATLVEGISRIQKALFELKTVL